MSIPEQLGNALIRAVNTDDLEGFIAVLNSNSEDILLPLKYLSNGYTPLQYCAQRDSLRVLKFLNDKYYCN